MKQGFIKVAAASPMLRVADVKFNTEESIKAIKEAAKNGAKVIVLPELGLTAYTCGDLFFQTALIEQAKNGVLELARQTADDNILAVVGMPLAVGDKLYNTAAFVKDGKLLGFAAKSNLPNYSEFYEQRHFSVPLENTTVDINGEQIPVGSKLLFKADDMQCLCIGAEICEDLWTPDSPGTHHALNGATLIVNPSASNEIIGKRAYRQSLLEVQSARCICGYIYADAGSGESTTDVVFSGHNMIYENGVILAESKPFDEKIIYTDLDLERMQRERRRTNTFKPENGSGYDYIGFSIGIEETRLERDFNRHPFVPSEKKTLSQRCEEIFAIQYHGLKKRLEHIGLKTVTVGISGGLDSTLALLVTVRAFKSLKLPVSGINAVTMPCFGTTGRTYNNAKRMIKALGANFVEVDIKSAVTGHLSDIGADINVHDVTYENAQARERTQVLMDIANKTGGIVIGTGDLSELALGFATYNGDHMSMYGVNASIPKTLVRYLVKYVADSSDAELKETLYDVLDTPVSPELLPPEEDGTIAQQTEEIVGPYELHDFFLYYMVRWGYSKEKIQRAAQCAFDGIYDRDTIAKWLNIFVRRFTNSQFKRSCLPDGPKVGSVALSPRGDWRMPSDASQMFCE